MMKILRTDETIVAQASARGQGIRGIVRLSGPLSLDALKNLFRADEDWTPDRPQVVSGEILFGQTKIPAPCDLYFWPEGRGFTRQLSAELHLPGNQPLIDSTIQTLCRNGCRLASPGEFTLRAFLAGRIDLSQAEAVLGVIDSKDENELKLALSQLAGGIRFPWEHLHETILDILTHLEAEFDFADEDIEFIDRDMMKQTIEKLLEAIQRVQQQIEHRADTSELPSVALVGTPNVGKSRLFNSLTQMAARESGFHSGAIVSEHSGTTRDYLVCECTWQNVGFRLIDTAGLETANPSELFSLPHIEAQQKTRESLESADLIIFCQPWQEDDSFFSFLAETQSGLNAISIWTKADHVSEAEIAEKLVTSAKTSHGLDALLTQIVDLLKRSQHAFEVLPSTALRCREMLNAASASLTRAISLNDDVLIASELRYAWEQIGMITGSTFHDTLLDRIFSRFCIGK